MKHWRFALLAIAVTAAMVGVGWGVGRWRGDPPADPAPGAGKRGALLYQVHCAACHGAEGHGDGTSAASLRPPPRDFARRPWRFEPTEESIRRVTRDGIAQTAMPAFAGALACTELDAVAHHVHELASGPAFESPPSEETRLLEAAGFTDLHGIDPPPLVVANAAGKSVALADLKGKLTLLHFWGVGCVHCIKEMPALDELAKANAGRLVVLHVSADQDDPQAAQKILDRLVPGAVSHAEPSGLGLARFEASLLPTVWLIGADGKTIGRASGARDWTAPPQKALIARLLKHASNGEE